MRDNVKAFVKDVAELFQIHEPVYEFGSLQVPGQEGYADLRPFFPGKRYVGCDARLGVGVDQIDDLMRLSLGDETVGTVLILDTLEHVENCHLAMEEVCRVLRPEGILAISSVMLFPIHEYPCDYWRFTPEGFRLLLQGFQTALISYEGEPEIPHTVFGLASKSRLPEGAVAEYLRRRQQAQPTGGPVLFSLENDRNYWRQKAEALEKQAGELAAELGKIRATSAHRLFFWLEKIGLTR